MKGSSSMRLDSDRTWLNLDSAKPVFLHGRSTASGERSPGE